MTSPALWGLAGAVSRALPATASPGPVPGDVVRTPEPDLVTPGTIGFLVTFGVAVALVLLVRDMVRRNRGLVVRAERRDAELRDAELRDAELRDAGLRDAGLRDAGLRDAGLREADGGADGLGAAPGEQRGTPGPAPRPGPPAPPGDRPGADGP